MLQADAREYLWSKIIEYRRKADSITESKLATQLRDIAKEYESRLAELDARLATDRGARRAR